MRSLPAMLPLLIYSVMVVVAPQIVMAQTTKVSSTGTSTGDAAPHNSLRVGVFRVDATPPLGTPVAYALARKIEDPLTARGVVLLGAGQPIVLCAVDWIGISNGGHDVWRESLAKAVGTSVDRVAVHVLHQHDAVRCDFTAEELLAPSSLWVRLTTIGTGQDRPPHPTNADDRTHAHRRPARNACEGSTLLIPDELLSVLVKERLIDVVGDSWRYT